MKFHLIKMLRKLVSKLIPRKNIEKEMSVQIAVSSAMDNAIQIWKDMYENNPPWKSEQGVLCSNIPATIAEEMARLILTEFEIEISGDKLGNFLDEQLKRELWNIDSIVERYCAQGGIVLKPFVSVDAKGKPSKIEIDVIDADRFFPTAYNSKGEITSAVFVQYKRVGEYLYTRLEYHELNGDELVILNKAYKSEKLISFNEGQDPVINEPLKEEIGLAEVNEWAGLSVEPVVIKNVDKPLFVYIKTGSSNNVDTASPLGISIYARSVDLIHEADKLLGKIEWEYDATETAIHVSNEYLDLDKQGKPIMPEGHERLYRAFDGSGNEGKLFDIYSPSIRDSSMFNGLNKILKRIEWNVGFAYGTISDPDELEKTAEEIKSSKQRSYRTVARMQSLWKTGLENLVESMSTLNSLYNIVPYGEYEVNILWGDAVMEDTDKEYQRRWQMVIAGKLKPEKFISWYFGVSEEDALEMMPRELPAFGEE